MAPKSKLEAWHEERIKELGRLGFTKAQIFDELQQDSRWSGNPISRRSIERAVDRFRARDESAPWSLSRSHADRPADVLEAMAYVHRRSEGRVCTIPSKTAQWISRIREAQPTLPIHVVWHLVNEYMLRMKDGEAETTDLDMWLAWWPLIDFHDKASVRHYWEQHTKLWPTRTFLLVLPREMAGPVANTEERIRRHRALTDFLFTEQELTREGRANRATTLVLPEREDL